MKPVSIAALLALSAFATVAPAHAEEGSRTIECKSKWDGQNYHFTIDYDQGTVTFFDLYSQVLTRRATFADDSISWDWTTATQCRNGKDGPWDHSCRGSAWFQRYTGDLTVNMEGTYPGRFGYSCQARGGKIG